MFCNNTSHNQGLHQFLLTFLFLWDYHGTLCTASNRRSGVLGPLKGAVSSEKPFNSPRLRGEVFGQWSCWGRKESNIFPNKGSLICSLVQAYKFDLFSTTCVSELVEPLSFSLELCHKAGNFEELNEFLIKKLENYQALLYIFHIFSQTFKLNYWNSHFYSFLHAWIPLTLGTISQSRMHESKVKPTLVEPHSPNGFGNVPFDMSGLSNWTNTGDIHKKIDSHIS